MLSRETDNKHAKTKKWQRQQLNNNKGEGVSIMYKDIRGPMESVKSWPFDNLYHSPRK